VFPEGENLVELLPGEIVLSLDDLGTDTFVLHPLVYPTQADIIALQGFFFRYENRVVALVGLGETGRITPELLDGNALRPQGNTHRDKFALTDPGINGGAGDPKVFRSLGDGEQRLVIKDGMDLIDLFYRCNRVFPEAFRAFMVLFTAGRSTENLTPELGCKKLAAALALPRRLVHSFYINYKNTKYKSSATPNKPTDWGQFVKCCKMV
jgi:hypothetical protein